MGLITVSKLRQDMQLASDLIDANGRLILNKGARLTSGHLQVFKKWGILEADIAGLSPEESADDLQSLQTSREEIYGRFIHADLKHPVIQELLRICTLRAAAGLGGKISPLLTEARQDPGAAPPFFKKPAGEQMADYIREDVQLSTLPDIFLQINEAISKPNSSAYDIANVIGKDTNLSAQLLRIVNSAFYSATAEIDSISRAVTVIGTKQLSILALGINIVNVFKYIPPTLIDMQAFWRHSVACGIVARLLAGYKKIINTERLFVAGLLHDIGRLLFYNYMPEAALFLLMEARKQNKLLDRIEREVLQLDHSAIGGMLLKKWKLPVLLEESVKFHHDPPGAGDTLEASIVHLADIMANAMAIGSSGEQLLPSLSRQAWYDMGLSKNVIMPAIKQADRQIDETLHFLIADDR